MNCVYLDIPLLTVFVVVCRFACIGLLIDLLCALLVINSVVIVSSLCFFRLLFIFMFIVLCVYCSCSFTDVLCLRYF